MVRLARVADRALVGVDGSYIGMTPGFIYGGEDRGFGQGEQVLRLQ